MHGGMLRLSSLGAQSAASISSLDDAIRRSAKAYEAADVDALFFTGIKAKAELESDISRDAAAHHPRRRAGSDVRSRLLSQGATGQNRAARPRTNFGRDEKPSMKRLKRCARRTATEGLDRVLRLGRFDRAGDARGRRERSAGRISWTQAMTAAIRRVTIRGRVQGVGYRAWVDRPGRGVLACKAGCAKPPRRQRRKAVFEAG